MNASPKADFLHIFRTALTNGTFIKATFGKPSGSEGAQKAFLRPVEIAGEKKIQFLYRFQTKDVTKNHSFADTVTFASDLLGKDFLSATLCTTDADHCLSYNRKLEPSLTRSKPTAKKEADLSHDRTKNKSIPPSAPFLRELWLTTSTGEIAKGKERKFRQIEKFIETFDSLFRESDLASGKTIRVVDMGSGMGYLTFAVYDYLNREFPGETNVVGIEARPDLVDACNDIAMKTGFTGLSFLEWRIGDRKLEDFDVLIALHACDTATDDALFQAVESSAKIILSVPCCHKEIRSQIKTEGAWQSGLDFGIVAERQSEMVTDVIRALLLQSCGYKTNVSEFISSEHTAKNVLITGVKKPATPKTAEMLAKVSEIKSLFGVGKQKLETLLESARGR